MSRFGWRGVCFVSGALIVASIFLAVIYSRGGKHAHFDRGVSLLNDLIAISAIAVGALVTVFVLDGFTPRLNVRLTPRWEGDVILISMEVENRSRVRAVRPYVQLMVVEQNDFAVLSEWVPFDGKRHVIDPEPVGVIGPVRVFRTTDSIYPGEVVSGSRLVRCSADASAAQIGLRATLPRKVKPEEPDEQLPAPLRNLDKLRRSHTTTAIVVRPSK